MDVTSRLRLPALVLFVCLGVCSLHAQTADPAQPAIDPQAVQARMQDLRQSLRSASDEFRFGAVRLSTERLPVFTRVEADFTLAASFDNPFDPEQIAVDGLIRRPDGHTVTVPAFFCTPFEPVKGLTQMTIDVRYKSAGPSGWKLRYAPEEPGEYALVLRARNASGRETRSAEVRFRAEPSDRKGFVRVARGNPNYFENSGDGSLFWGVGSNVAWTRQEESKRINAPASYEHYFGRAAGKMNATRVWLCHWAWLEWTPQKDDAVWPGYGGAGYYNQMIATALDRVFELAEKQQLRVMLVTEDNDELMTNGKPIGTWPGHPYNVVNGGPCRQPSEIFTNSDARRLYRNRLRYIIARWGYSDSLWAINSMNDHSKPSPQTLEWVTEARDYVHQLFDGWRPIIYGTNLRFEAGAIADYYQARGPAVPGKPNIVQECYYTPVVASFRHELHEQLWGGLSAGLAAIMVWDHVLVEKSGAWDEFQPLMRFVEDLPLHKRTWERMNVKLLGAKADAPGPYPRATAMRSYGDVPQWGVKSPANRFEVDLDSTNQWLEGFCPTLWGEKKKEWRNPPVFLLDMPEAGQLLVEVSEIGSNDNALVVSRRAGDDDDWTQVSTVAWEGGRRSLKPDEQWVRIPLPKGRQQVRLDSTGDWMRLHRVVATYSKQGAEALASASGWTDGRHAFVYVQNQSHARLLSEVLGSKPLALRDVELRLAGLRDGSYQVEVFDTGSGKPLSSKRMSCRSGSITVRLPDVDRDAAVKILPVRE